MKDTVPCPKIIVSAGGQGLVSQAGTWLPLEAAPVAGLGRGLSGRAGAPGKIVTDLVVALGLGGDCIVTVIGESDTFRLVIDGETARVVPRTTSHQIDRYKAHATHPGRR